MLRCNICGEENSEGYTEIPNHGIFCEACLDRLAAEGLTQARQDALELGDSVVAARFDFLQKELDKPTIFH